jgi:hypothetical protein
LADSSNIAVFFFENHGDSELFLASADWMERNFFRRVEIAFPVREQTHRERICAISIPIWPTIPGRGRSGATDITSAANEVMIRCAMRKVHC